jgi:hypothetical protein
MMLIRNSQMALLEVDARRRFERAMRARFLLPGSGGSCASVSHCGGSWPCIPLFADIDPQRKCCKDQAGQQARAWLSHRPKRQACS